MRRRAMAFFMTCIMLIGLVGVQQPYPVAADTIKAVNIETNDTIEISNLAELEAFRDSVNGGNNYVGVTVKLTADIDMSEKYGRDINGNRISWTPISSFAGTFDGNGHEITGLYIENMEDYQGLFGKIETSGIVKKLGVDGYVFGYNHVGGIASENSGKIINCYNKANINGIRYVGGIAGYSNSYRGVSYCYNMGTVKGDYNYNDTDRLGYSIISNNNYNLMFHCYYLEGTGKEYNASIVDSSAAAKLSEAEFKEQTSFVNWDFDKVWKMSKELGRPVFRSEQKKEELKISTLAELEAFRDAVNNGNSYAETIVMLTADIDMSGKYGSDIRGKEVSWTPIGDDENAFEGVFDGGGHEITGLYINTNNYYQGLFGYAWQNSIIQNLTVSGSVTGGNYVGGIIGYQRGNLINCHQKGNVVGGSYVGGIAGFEGLGIVRNCSNTGSVSGTGNQIGGVFGRALRMGAVSTCYNEGDVNGEEFVGGIIGNYENISYAKVSMCYNIGNINGLNSIGGIIGYNKYGEAKDCYNIGSVLGEERIGGVVGDNEYGKVEDCYNAEYILGIKGYEGYVAGYGDDSNVSGSYYLYDEEYGDKVETSGVKALSEKDFMRQSAFVNWNFSNVWMMSSELGRPILKANKEEKMTVTISTLAELEAFRDSVNNGSTYKGVTVMLKADIDMSGKYGPDISGKEVSWKPIGNDRSAFKGIFDGGGHKITGLYINTVDDYQGLFGYAENSIIQNLDVNGNVTGGDYVGGIIGCQRGNLINCHKDGKVNGKNNVGGVVGYEESGMVRDCFNTGNVYGTGNQIGGVIGHNVDTGLVSMCYNWGDVNGGTYEDGEKGGESVGGVIGKQNNSSYTKIAKCYNKGDVDGINAVGGIIGHNHYGEIETCYNVGDVLGSDKIGGVAGDNKDGKVETCYNSGYVIGLIPYMGYVIGYGDKANVSDCFYLFYESYNFKGESDGIKALLEEDFTKQSTFENWDFTNVWVMSNELGRPVLQAPKEEKRIETISSLEELEAFRDSVNGGNTYKGVTVMLTTDIDMSGKCGANINGKEISWTPIGISYEESFRGTFDGNGHEIKGLYINTSENYQGLFGWTYGAEVKNINVSGNVYGGWMVGGIAGYNQEGLMENCHNAVKVVGGWNCEEAYYVGGVTGRNDGTLKNCSNEGDIACSKGTIGTGGVAGVNYMEVLDCSNTGSVSGRQSTGGIVGENEGDVENCHNTGDVYGFYYVGGIVGNNSSDVSYCSNKGCISGTEESNSIGGVVGSSEGTVRSCYNTEAVSGYASVGGIVGSNWSLMAECYNKGTVTGNGSNVGGVTGNNMDRVILCYNTGNVTSKFYNVGGVCGQNNKEGIISGCYSIGNVSGIGGVGGVVGANSYGGIIKICHYLTGTAQGGVEGQDIEDAKQRTMADFSRKSTFYNWDFNAEWEMSSDLGRPVLRSNKEILTEFQLGDVDGDRAITSKDALAILKNVAEIKQNVFIEEAADCDKDGVVTEKDALRILQHVVEIIQIF